MWVNETIACTEVRSGSDPRAVVVKNASTVALAENPQRAGLSLVNDSEQAIYLGVGHPAVLHTDIVLYPGGSWDGRIGNVTWVGEVNAIVANGEANLLVVEVV